jgi:hypothetical protein
MEVCAPAREPAVPRAIKESIGRNQASWTPSGIFALQAFFGEPGRYTKADAVLNLAVLGLCIAAVLFLLERLLQRQAAS